MSPVARLPGPGAIPGLADAAHCAGAGISDRDRAMLEIARQLATAIPMHQDPDLTGRQLLLLHLLSQAPRAVGEIARELGITISSASGLVDRLARLRLISRARADPPGDRRQVTCHLTSDGATALTDHLKVGNLRLETLLSELTSDEIQLVERAMALLIRAAHQVIAKAQDAPSPLAAGRP